MVLSRGWKNIVEGKIKLGSGAKSLGEIKALFPLLKVVEGMGILHLQIFGDSILEIEWMMEELQITNLDLSYIVDQLHDPGGSCDP